ncbi:MAG: HDOD domain-containing protein [Nitrospirae bacterium]|nr:HDOD domain-containing protein [Nitrospirota bacterium]
METDEQDKIFEDFERENGFSAMPEVVSEVLFALQSSRTTMHEVGEIIMRDPGFSTRLIHYANSGAYFTAVPASSIDQAVRIIGLGPLKGLCLGLPVFTRYKHVLGVREIWAHSRATAICCQIVSEAVRFPEPDTAETAGLLHDIGKVVLAVSAGNFFLSQIQVADSPERKPDWKQEKEHLGFNHCFIGGWFARKFQMPPPLVEAILWHHEYEKSRYGRDLACLCMVGDQIAASIGFSHPDDVFVEPGLVGALKHLGIDDALFRRIMTRCLERVARMVAYD